jgi:metal-responsive CopG/Arc/MetJ family transcriptional regulator
MSKTINVSLKEKLLHEFDTTIHRHGYKTRSSAISDSMRDFIDKLNERTLIKLKVEREMKNDNLP